MTLPPFSTIKLAIAVVALIVFGYGVRVDSEFYRLMAIGLLVVAFLLRFVEKRRRKHVE